MSRDFLKFPKADDAEVIITANAAANKIMKIIVVFEKNNLHTVFASHKYYVYRLTCIGNRYTKTVVLYYVS